MPRFFFSTDEFAKAAHDAISVAGPERPVALLVADMDGYELLAQAHGPRFTQNAMSVITEMATQMLRAEDLLVRASGDRLYALLAGSRAEEGRSAALRLCAATRTHAYTGVERTPALPVTISVGVAAAPEHGESFDVLFAAADRARTRLKEQGKDGAAIATPAHHQPLHRSLVIERFAGRASELTSLVRLLDETCAGSPRVIAVVGESGIGSSALLGQLEPEVWLRGGTFVTASCSASDVREPYAPWGTILRALARMPHAPDQPWRELQNLVPSLGSGRASGQHGHSQYRLLDEIAQYVRAVAADRPLVVKLDDMQWADVTSWDALEHLIDQLEHDRVMVCVTLGTDSAQPNEVGEHRRTLGRHERASEIALSRLTRNEVKQWVEAAFHSQQVGREFLAFVYRHTEGNPLFIANLLHALVEDGALWRSENRWEWSPVSELRLPAGRSALIAHRVSQLSSSTQAVLGVAGVIGLEFDVGLVVGAGAGSEAAVRLGLSEALAASLIKPASGRRQGGYAFMHSQIVDVVVESIPKEHRRELHDRVAQALERCEDARAWDIAQHYDRGGNAPAAHKFAQLAAADADRVYANSASRAYLQIAARNATSPAELAEVRATLAKLAETSGRYDEAEELCDLAIEWFEGHDDKRRALTLRRMRERARIELGQPVRVTLENLMAMDHEAQAIGFDRERVTILAMASQSHGRLGDQRTAERIASECVGMAERIGDPTLLAEALQRNGVAILQEAPARARELFLRALELFERTGDVRGQASCQLNLGIAANVEGRLVEAGQAWTMASTIARAAGLLDVWGQAAVNLGVLAQRVGDYDGARARFGEALEIFASIKNSELQLVALFNMADIELELSAWDSALKLYEATSPLAQRVGQSDVELGSAASAGLCFLELGRHSDAITALRDVESNAHVRPDWFQGRERLVALSVRVAIMEGRVDDAVATLEAAIALVETTEPYAAAWLTAWCAEALLPHRPEWVRATVHRLGSLVQGLGYVEMTRRFAALGKL